MNALPRVTTEPAKGGWLGKCSACPWSPWEPAGLKHVLDKAAREHQGKCRPGGRK